MRWEVVPGFPQYEVSECGEVRTRFKSATRPAHRVLKGSIKFGYRRYELWLPEEKRDVCVGAHWAVCAAFHGPAPSDAHEPAHWDGDRLNNHLSNLRWATRVENAADRRRHGTQPFGSRVTTAKLTEAQVAELMASRTGRRGEQKEFADRFGVSECTISNIVNGHRWRDATGLSAFANDDLV